MDDKDQGRDAPTAIKGSGPDEHERLAPGDTGTNPAGASSEKPAKGAEDAAPRREGAPEG